MYNNDICPRCGSPRKISRTWSQTIELYSGNKSQVEVSQFVCTNVECQKRFDELRAEEISRNQIRKDKKEEQDKIRKEKLAQSIANARKGKSAKA